MTKLICKILIVILLIYSSCRNEISDFRIPTTTKPGLLVLKSKTCSFTNVSETHKDLKITINNPNKNQLAQVSTIMKFSGLPQNFSIYCGNIQTAIATSVNNQRLVIINNNLFSSSATLDSSYWSSLFIIAHEIGHHLAFNLNDSGKDLQAELDADKFAAAILFRMGADSNQVLTAVSSNLVSNIEGTAAYPSKIKRIEDIKKIWMKAAQLRYKAVVPPPIDDDLAIREFTYKNLIIDEDVMEYKNQLEGKEANRQALQEKENSAVLRNFEGTIVKFEEGNYPDFNNFLIVDHNYLIDVLVTHIDPVYHDIIWGVAPMEVNKVYSLEVRYKPFLKEDKIDDFLKFFAPGRRFEFDVLSTFPDTYGYENYTFISRAKATN